MNFSAAEEGLLGRFGHRPIAAPRGGVAAVCSSLKTLSAGSSDLCIL